MIEKLRHYFLPHHTNGHRAKILHHKSLSIALIVFLGFAFLLPPLRHEYPSVLGMSFNISAQDLVSQTNQKRAEAGLSPLVLNEQLSNAAAQKAQYMLEKNFWAHVAPDGTTPWYFIKNSGYEYLYAGENLARGFNSTPDVISAWMASATHRENMLSPNYSDVGFAVVSGSLTGSDTVLVVEELGSTYPAKKEVAVAKAEPAVTEAPAQSISQARSPSISPLPTISKAPSRQQERGLAAVAAVSNKPLVDSKSTTRNLALVFVAFVIGILFIDLIIVERQKITRIVAHNLDHIIFLLILLSAAIIIGRGVIL